MFRPQWLLLTLCLAAASALSQSAPSSSAPIDAQQYVAAQFGPAFTLLAKPGTMVGDLDADGAEDAIFVATAKNPLLDEAEFHYRTIDPYNTFYGFGDPRVTMQFTSQEGQPRYILVVHNWRAATPKAKFVIINLPFEKLALARIAVKKKVVPCIAVEDRTGAVSSVYWNGKQYKWVDTDTAQP